MIKPLEGLDALPSSGFGTDEGGKGREREGGKGREGQEGKKSQHLLGNRPSSNTGTSSVFGRRDGGILGPRAL